MTAWVEDAQVEQPQRYQRLLHHDMARRGHTGGVWWQSMGCVVFTARTTRTLYELRSTWMILG